MVSSTVANDSISEYSIETIHRIIHERDEARKVATKYREQLGAIFIALELIAKLAAMDSITYQQIRTCNDGKPDKESFPIQSQLDNIIQNWKVEDIHLDKVIYSVRRLQSQLFHTQIEADTVTAQIESLNDDNIKYKERNKKLEKAAKLLFQDNSVLSQELIGTKSQYATSKKYMKEYVESIDRNELKRRVSHVNKQQLLHETIMRTTSSKSDYLTSNNEDINNSVHELDQSSIEENGTKHISLHGPDFSSGMLRIDVSPLSSNKGSRTPLLRLASSDLDNMRGSESEQKQRKAEEPKCSLIDNLVAGYRLNRKDRKSVV